MQMSVYDSAKFKKLQAAWYKKLEQSGFEDIEQNDQEENLKRWHGFYFMKRHAPQAMEASARYYEVAGFINEHYPFPDSVRKKIWDLHSAGHSYTDISNSLKIKRWFVERFIQRVAHLLRLLCDDDDI